MAIKIPLVVTQNREMNTFQTQLGKSLQPVLSSPLNEGMLLTGISLVNGATDVSHKLGRMMQGWYVTDINGVASIYRSQPFNATTLTLTSNAAVTVNLWVF